MDVKDYLRSVWYAREEIERLSLRIREMQAQATKITASLSGMPHGGGSDAQALWARIVDDTDKLYRLQHRYFDRIAEVESFIDRIGDDRHRAILKLRYVNCLPWPEVVRRMANAGYSYDERHIFRLHGAALETARAIWTEKKEEEIYAADD